MLSKNSSAGYTKITFFKVHYRVVAKHRVTYCSKSDTERCGMGLSTHICSSPKNVDRNFCPAQR